MDNNTKFVLKEFLRFICCAFITVVLLFIIFGISHFDIVRAENISELSLTEILQELLLAVSTGIFIFIARKHKKQGVWLVSGFLCCMFIRELDIVFDTIFHGAWKYLALLTAVFFIFLALRKGLTALIADLVQFMKKRNYSILFVGLLLTLIVSRMAGSMELIKLLAIKSDYYQYLFKNFLEEGIELLGYLILFISACCYLYEYKKANKNPLKENLSGE